MPRYSIITPTILRPSLIRTCESVNNQSCSDWEHIVMVDRLDGDIPSELNHPQRKIFRCSVPHKNWGSRCRYDAWALALGEYIHYLDDDNYYPDTEVLNTLNRVIKPWAIFPILKPLYGGFHFFCPPMRGCTDGGSLLVQRDLGRWPDTTGYDVDGILVDRLKQYDCEALLGRPLMVWDHNPA